MPFTHSPHSSTKHLHIMPYGKLVVLPGAAGLPGGAATGVLPGAAACRVFPGTCPHLTAGRRRVAVPGSVPGCRVARCVLPGTAGLPGRCRGGAGATVAGLGCRRAGLPGSGARGLKRCPPDLPYVKYWIKLSHSLVSTELTLGSTYS